MLKIGKLTDYAVVVLSHLSKEMGAYVSAAYVSDETKIPETTVAKVLKMLAKANLVLSHRGSNGGYMLKDNMKDISLVMVIEAIEGSINIADCMDGRTGECVVECHCQVRGNWDRVNMAIYNALAGISLADMALPIGGCARTEEVMRRFTVGQEA